MTQIDSASSLAAPKVYEGGPHGIPMAHEDCLNQDLLAFIRG